MQHSSIHNIVYRITNTVNGMIYIGIHRTNNIDDRYMGSGVELRKAQAEYGIENFTKEILFSCDTYDEVRSIEAHLVDKVFIDRSDTYNMIPGGGHGFTYLNAPEGIEKRKISCIERYGVQWPMQSDSVKNKSKLTSLERYGVTHHLKLDEFLDKQRSTNLKMYGTENQFNRDEVQQQIRITTVEKYGVDYHSQTESRRIDLSERNVDNEYAKGFKWFNDTKTEVFIHESDTRNLDGSWVEGRLCQPLMDRISVHKSDEIKFIEKCDLASYIDNGWSIGNGKTHNRGRVYVKRGTTNKRIYDHQLDEHLADGWVLGMFRKPKGSSS